MEVKRFTGRSWQEALEKTRSEFGDDAVILYTSAPEPGFFQKLFGHQKFIVVAARDVNLITDSAKPKPEGAPGEDLTELLNEKYAASRDPSSIADFLEDVASSSSYNQTNGTGSPESKSAGEPRSDRPSPDVEKQRSSADASSDLTRSSLGNIESMLNDLSRYIKHNEFSSSEEELFSTYRDMLENNISKVVAVNIIEQLKETLEPEELNNRETIQLAIRESLKEMIPTADPIKPVPGSCQSVAVVGPTGVGKTTTIAKLAGNFALRENCSVGLVTIDTYRLGAATQLQKVASLLEIPCRSARNPGDFEQTVSEMEEFDLILIDTLGTSQYDQNKIDHLNEFFDAERPDQVHLVLSANSSDSALLDTIQSFSPLEIDRIIFSKIDESSRLGLILNILNKVDTGISYITTGQEIPKDIRVAQDEELAQLILGEKSHA